MVDAITANIPYTIPTGETLVNESFGPNKFMGAGLERSSARR